MIQPDIGAPVECHHPYRAVFWNPFNQCVQCHACGEVLARRETQRERDTSHLMEVAREVVALHPRGIMVRECHVPGALINALEAALAALEPRRGPEGT